MVVETVFAMMMIVNGSIDGFMKTDGLSDCLKVKRQAERNLSDNRENIIRYECSLVKAQLEEDYEGNMKIKKILEKKN
tara:strand:+ start:221 stop:454 length:234 start_codon:yes stop_codon:yes gene_type:complete